MTYTQFNVFYKNNEFRKIDADSQAEKFYLLRSISKYDDVAACTPQIAYTNDLARKGTVIK